MQRVILVLKAFRASRVRQVLQVQLALLALLARLALRVFRESLAQPELLVTLVLLERRVRLVPPGLLAPIQRWSALRGLPARPERLAPPALIRSLLVQLVQLAPRALLVLMVLSRLVLVLPSHPSRVISGLIPTMALRMSTTIASGLK